MKTDNNTTNTNLGKYDEEKNLEKYDANANLEKYTPKIGVLGLGGAGTNTVELLQKRLGDSVRFIICNTDVQSVKASSCKNKILLGPKTTKGKGAGGKPAVGRAATEESLSEIMELIEDLDMIVIVAGAGGGTGTGAVNVVGKAAREKDILTIAIITSPFGFEGKGRDVVAEKCIRELEDHVDTLVVNRNQKLLEMTKGKASFIEAFEISDKFSADCVESFVSIIQETDLMNVDFADIKTIAKDRRSKAIMGTGYADGEDAGMRAINEAMSSFLLESEQSWSDVDNVLLCVRGGSDLSIEDVSDIGDKVKSSVDPNANIIMGANTSFEAKGSVRIFVFGITHRKSGANIHNKKSTIDKKDADPKLVTMDYENREFIGDRHDLNEDISKFGAKDDQTKKKRFSFWNWGRSKHNKESESDLDIPDFLK